MCVISSVGNNFNLLPCPCYETTYNVLCEEPYSGEILRDYVHIRNNYHPDTYHHLSVHVFD